MVQKFSRYNYVCPEIHRENPRKFFDYNDQSFLLQI